MSIVGKVTLLVVALVTMMGSVLTPLSAAVLFLGVTCIEWSLELHYFSAN
jgi:heme/copper-type cytochrome/quinol oxidase subunit 4